MVPILIRPINEIEGSGQCSLDREEMEYCWNCGGILQYVQNVMGLVMFEKDIKPTIIPVEQNFFCAQCGKHQKSWEHAEDKDVIMTFDDTKEAKDAEYLLAMKGSADSFKEWSEDKYKELMKRIEDFTKNKNG